MEQFFTAQGLLLPSHHGSYWLGLSAAAAGWPNFRWTDNVTPVPGLGSYQGWGTMTFTNTSVKPLKEPNNLSFRAAGMDELCAAANASQAYNNAWGWSDVQCSLKMASICKRHAPRVHVYVTNSSAVAGAGNSTASATSRPARAAAIGGVAGGVTRMEVPATATAPVSEATFAMAANVTTGGKGSSVNASQLGQLAISLASSLGSSLSSSRRYMLYTAQLDQRSAQKACNDMGGHLAAYFTEAEQVGGRVCAACGTSTCLHEWTADGLCVCVGHSSLSS